MKITSFHPLIVASHPEDTIALFESIGFEVAHQKRDISLEDGSEAGNNTVMKNPDGRKVEIAAISNLYEDVKDTVMIRTNVDDLEEAVNHFTSKGFTVVARATSGSADYCTVESPTGYRIDLCKHIKKH